MINFEMLGILCRLHCLEEIVFPRVLKHEQKQGKNVIKDYVPAVVTDHKIYQMIIKAQGRVKLMVEEL